MALGDLGGAGKKKCTQPKLSFECHVVCKVWNFQG